MGRTNSQLSGGATVGYNWEDLTAMTLGGTPAYPTTPYEITIPPKITSISGLFFNNANIWRQMNVVINNTGSDITDISAAFRRNDWTDREITINFDTSKITNWSEMFTRAGASLSPMNVIVNGVMDFSSATNIGNMFATWGFHTTKQTHFVLAQNSLSLSADWSNVNFDDVSLNSIVAGLKDLTGGTAQILTLNSNVSARLTAEQIATITAKNWTLA